MMPAFTHGTARQLPLLSRSQENLAAFECPQELLDDGFRVVRRRGIARRRCQLIDALRERAGKR
jgi:hypothetical protein